MTTVQAKHTGRCLCGGVRYQVSGELRGIIACSSLTDDLPKWDGE